MRNTILLTVLCLLAGGSVFAQQYYTEQDIRDAYDRGFRNGYGVGYNDSRGGYYYRAQNPGNLNPQNYNNYNGNNPQGYNNAPGQGQLGNPQGYAAPRSGQLGNPNQNNWQMRQQFEQLLQNLDNYYVNMIQNQNRNQVRPNQVAPNQAAPNQMAPNNRPNQVAPNQVNPNSNRQLSPSGNAVGQPQAPGTATTR